LATEPSVFGKNIFEVTINPNAKILDVDIKSNFYKFGKKVDTPINRGKEIYNFAKKNGYDVIRLAHVPYVAGGTEFAVLNKNVIEKQRLHDIIESITSGSLEEYYKAIENSYKNKFVDPEDVETFMEFLKMNDEETAKHLGIDINIEKEDDGTLLLAYGENATRIFLFGIVSTKEKMNKIDVSAIHIWIDRLIEKMKEGKTFITSPHELSLRLLKHIESKLEKDPKYTLHRSTINKINLKDLGFNLKDKRYSNYENVQLKLIKK
jgi:hypothetical protein